MRVRLSPNEISFIEQHISKSAKFDAVELVAEVKAGLLLGKTFDARIMEWYNRYGGPK